MYEDKILRCKDCGNEFVFTAGEQEFYAEKGFVNEPQALQGLPYRSQECNQGKSRNAHDRVCGLWRRSTYPI